MPIRELSPDQKRRFRKPAGLFILVIGVFLAWFTLYRPLVEARHTGILDFSFKALFFNPTFLFLGAFLTLTTLEDKDLRQNSPTGKRTWTRAGWTFLAALLVFVAVTATAWVLYLRTQGFNVL